jgi:hypothetical protein
MTSKAVPSPLHGGAGQFDGVAGIAGLRHLDLDAGSAQALEHGGELPPAAARAGGGIHDGKILFRQAATIIA